ncbi:platelet-derived growth factor receptor-like protein isoform X1 [Podarcis raffonei]|uniref:Platelet-derived growth factor receptor-like protein n=3 Tax=Podarcis TaxID=42163 RepID=A0A670J425_PODMU|nr:platelet-derived growth factor receptor-like protein isoform X1 [Podarcis muralis]XP_053260457.1 platelet-derived growth factor receptor-like protein isoform X1 [Podarcis raffonei]CAI5783904.1 platelet-derived growth factor receptor [Podarcis lilfordi]
MKPWLLLLGLLLFHQTLQNAIGQPAKNKRPKEPGENRIKPANKKVKPKTPKLKERESTDASPKIHSIMTQVMDKGRFQKPAATLSLSAGQNLELRCKGNKIEWSHPSDHNRVSIRQHDRYGQLILANATAADTGQYSCWLLQCSGYNCKKDETKTGSTYIFFADKGELFVPSASYFEVVYLNPDKPAVVPCRVTSPSVKVSLHQEFPAEEIQVDGTNIIYDVKKGFIYKHPTSDHKGVVYCRAESWGAPQISIKYQLLYVEVPSGPPSTTIKASSSTAEGGDDISVLCTVLGEPDVEVEFNWIYPGQKYERPVVIQDSWRLIDRGIGHTTRISESLITVEDFETIDGGNYICIAQNLRGQTTVAAYVELI